MVKKLLTISLIVVLLISALGLVTPVLASSKTPPGISESANLLEESMIDIPSSSLSGNIQLDIVPGAYDIFLKIPGIPGESMDSDYRNWIDVSSFAWGLSLPEEDMSTRASGRVRAHGLAFSHLLDAASPKLMSACAKGEVIKEALLTLRYQGEGGHKFYELKISEVVVHTVNLSGSDLGQAGDISAMTGILSPKPIEEVTLGFTKIQWTYWPQKTDGTMDYPITGFYDLTTNKAQ
jgi:type VI secretion system secreted protein Hcp